MERYNIYYRRDGRYEGRISRGKNKNGKRKYQYFFGKTRVEVEKKISEARQNEKSQGYCIKTMSVLFYEWYQSIQHRVKESTAANYLMKAKKHILPFFENCRIGDVIPANIYAFMESKKKDGLLNRYICDIIILMKSIFKYAAKTYHIFNPMDGITLPKKKAPDIKLLDDNEQSQLQQYIANHPNRSTLGIALSLSTGIRIGELTALQWEDIDLKKRILTVKKTLQRVQCIDGATKTKLIITEPKSESSCRTIPIPECMVEFLTKFQGKTKDYVISGCEKATEPRTMQYRFTKILKNAKLPSVHFHALRHMFASNCVKLGFDVKALSEILGHSSVEITLNRYVHSSFEQKQAYMGRLKLAF